MYHIVRPDKPVYPILLPRDRIIFGQISKMQTYFYDDASVFQNSEKYVQG